MLRNKTKKRIIAENVRVCRSPFSKAIGLMFSRKGAVKRALMFIFKEEKIVSLHMFFVFYPIDVLFLDKNRRVVQIKENFKPFRIMLSKKPAKYILELPCGAVRKTKTDIGDVIS